MKGSFLRVGTTMPLAARTCFSPMNGRVLRLHDAYLGRAMEDLAVNEGARLLRGMRIPSAAESLMSVEPSRRPTIGLFTGMSGNWAIAAHGQRVHRDADWLVIPNVPGNAFIQGGSVFVHGAVGFDWDEARELAAKFMFFPDPARIDRLFSVRLFPGEIEERLVGLGYTMVNPGSFKIDKGEGHRIFEEARVRNPRSVAVGRSEGHTVESIADRIHEFLSRHGATRFVVKPAAGIQGKGVRMFERDEIDVAASHAHDLLSRWDGILVEERLDSYPLLIDGKRMDWNMRVVVPPGDLNEWNILDTTEVRYNDFNGRPVNKSRGARIAEVETIFDLLNLSKGQREGVVEKLRAMSDSTMEVVRGRLLAEYGERASSYELLVGLDMILERDLDPSMIEVNLGVIGGINSLIDIREGDDAFRTVDVIVRNLLESAATAGASRQGSADALKREYLEDPHSWMSLGRAMTVYHAPALEAFERAIELDPDYDFAWFRKGVLLKHCARFEEALAAFERAAEIDPYYFAARIDEGEMLAELGRLEEAVAAYERAIELEPDNPLPRYEKLKLLMMLGKEDEAWMEALVEVLNMFAAYGKSNLPGKRVEPL